LWERVVLFGSASTGSARSGDLEMKRSNPVAVSKGIAERKRGKERGFKIYSKGQRKRDAAF